MSSINSHITEKDLQRARQRLLKEGGIRPQWITLADNEDVGEKLNKKTKQIIVELKKENYI